MDIGRYRKAVIAFTAAAVTVAHAFGVPVADGLSVAVIAAFDSLAALLVLLVPNKTE